MYGSAEHVEDNSSNQDVRLFPKRGNYSKTL